MIFCTKLECFKTRLEKRARDTHSSLLRKLVKYGQKNIKILDLGLMLQSRNILMFVKVRVLVPVRPYQPSLMFASNAGAYLSEAPFRCSTLR